MTLRDTTQADLPPQSFDHQTGYSNVIDVQFVSRALATGARRVKGTRWTTQALFPADNPDIIASAYYEHDRSFEALTRVGGALAHVIRRGETVTVRLAARDHAALEAAERQLRADLPESSNEAPNEVALEFSSWNERHGVSITTRTATAPGLSDITTNYSSAVRSGLGALMNGFRPGSGGRLLLWHGLPGSGKTWALRALAREWRSWCRLRYVTDPERLLNEPAYLVTLMHMRTGLHADGEDWRLIVLEDTGELLSADAKQ